MNTEGIHLPFAYDPESKLPSVTLGFYWIVSTLSIISLILLHIGKVTYTATGMSLVFVLLAFIMYRLRKLDKVKIDIDDQSIELDNNDEKDNK
jgi:tellurite resistance protein TehA-like permease